MRGFFIVFEGVDRCGKSSQSASLLSYLEDNHVKAELLKFPDRTTESGKTIDKYLKREINLTDEEALILFSRNRWECVPRIVQLLQSGVTVIVDRYAYSGICYAAAKGVPINVCIGPECGLPMPDVVFLLDLDIEIAASRDGFGSERFEEAQFQHKVRRHFLSLYDPCYWIKIDASRPMEDVGNEIKDNVDILFTTYPPDEIETI